MRSIRHVWRGDVVVVEAVMALTRYVALLAMALPMGLAFSACSNIVDPSTLPNYTSGDESRVDAGSGVVDATTGAPDSSDSGGLQDAQQDVDSTVTPADDGSASGTGSDAGSGTTSGSNSPDAGVDAGVAVSPSCAQGGPGMTNCGASSESCCTSLPVTGGTYYRTYTNSGTGPTGEADPATVSSFRLDKYLVTVGRFRQFVNVWNGAAGWTPAAGSGKHTHLNGGNGLNATGGGYEPGWATSDNNNIAPTNTNLACNSTYQTWTNAAGSQENLPINCVNWYESYAFCIWDGGFLPSEAEWEYAAAGGNEQREYPWGATPPGTSNYYAIYGCYYPYGPFGSGSCTGVVNIAPSVGNVGSIAPVGYAASGAGLWGQLDLAGNIWEWNLDWYATYAPCTDCANFTAASIRVIRGGYFSFTASYLLPPNRIYSTPTSRNPYSIGLRCSRTP